MGRARRAFGEHTRRDTESKLLSRCPQKGAYPLRSTQFAVRPRQESSSNFWTLKADSLLLLTLIAEKRFDVVPLISHRVRGEEAQKAYQLLMEWNPGLLGVVLQWNNDG